VPSPQAVAVAIGYFWGGRADLVVVEPGGDHRRELANAWGIVVGSVAKLGQLEDQPRQRQKRHGGGRIGWDCIVGNNGLGSVASVKAVGPGAGDQFLPIATVHAFLGDAAAVSPVAFEEGAVVVDVHEIEEIGTRVALAEVGYRDVAAAVATVAVAVGVVAAAKAAVGEGGDAVPVPAVVVLEGVVRPPSAELHVFAGQQQASLPQFPGVSGY